MFTTRPHVPPATHLGLMMIGCALIVSCVSRTDLRVLTRGSGDPTPADPAIAEDATTDPTIAADATGPGDALFVETSCADGRDDDGDSLIDCDDPDCVGRSCAAAPCATSSCTPSAECLATVHPAGTLCREPTGCAAPGRCSGVDAGCPPDSTLFWTSWEDGTDVLNTGGCFEWTGVVQPGDLAKPATCGGLGLDGVGCVGYTSVSTTDAAVYYTVAAADSLYARFMLRIADWATADLTFRSLFAFVTTPTPSIWADTTALYVRLERSGASSRFSVRYFDGAAWLAAGSFEYLPDTTYQIELQYETNAVLGGGKAGWRVWSGDGTTLLAATPTLSHTSTRQVASFFVGNGNANVSTSTLVYFDAVQVSTAGWVGPLRDPLATTSAPALSFAPVAAGAFTMGSPGTEACRGTDETAHPVTLSHDFELSTTEVTVGVFLAHARYSGAEPFACGLDCPVQNVSWDEAAAFANALSASRGLASCYVCTGSGVGVSCSVAPAYDGAAIYDCPGYRLPTEAEWEYAYRAGTTTPYYSGANDALRCADCTTGDTNADAIAWYCANNGGTLHAVAQKLGNPLGLFDMAGNVWEWTHDGYAGDYGSAAGNDPVTPATASNRTARGGGWDDSGSHSLRAARRRALDRTTRWNDTGFRLARSNPGR